MKHWLNPEIINHRTSLGGEIIGILTSTIKRLQTEMAAETKDKSVQWAVKEESEFAYDAPP